jgi:hypothetical protein
VLSEVRDEDGLEARRRHESRSTSERENEESPSSGDVLGVSFVALRGVATPSAGLKRRPSSR